MAEPQQETVESMIRWVETSAAQVRSPDGIEGYVIPVEHWRQMRSALRALTTPDPAAMRGDECAGGGSA